MRIHSSGRILPIIVLTLVAPLGVMSAQTAGTYVCTVRDASRQAGFVSQLFNVSQADAPKVTPAWVTAVKLYGVTASTPPTCQGYARFSAADSARKQFIAYVTNSLEQRIDQMSWTYMGLPRATGDAAVEVPSGPAGGSSAASDEMAQAKAYCVQNHSGLYDCDGFARAVADHRKAHPDEWEVSNGGGRYIAPIHDLETGIHFHLDCTACLDDQLLASWARQRVRQQFSAVVISKLKTQASVDAYADCVAKAFVPKMHAKPNVEDNLRNYNDATAGCGSPH